MRRTIIAVLILGVAMPALGLVEGNQVQYVSGTSNGIKAGTIGSFDTTGADELLFVSPGEKLPIAYAKMSHIEYHTQVARHLGVVAAAAAGLVRKRERKHFLDIAYTDSAGTIEVAHFEVAKEVPASLLPVLNARAPKACSGQNSKSKCSVEITYGP